MNLLTPSTPSMMSASTIEQARVVSVDPDKWTMVVRTTTHNKTISDVPILSFYLHQTNGEGVHYMPEPGSIIYIARPSDADAACIPLLFGGAADGKATYRANRSSMNPGDIFLYTRDDNGVRIKRGGTTEISSTPLAKTVYTYYDNAVTNIAENFHVKSLGSNIDVETDLPEENTEGKFGSRITLKSREYVGTTEEVVVLSLGRTDPTAPTDSTSFVYDLRVSGTYDRSINKDGDLVSSYNNSVYNYNNTEHSYNTATHSFITNTDFSGPLMNFGCNTAMNFNTPIATFSTAATVAGLLTVGGGIALSGGIVPGSPGSTVSISAENAPLMEPALKATTFQADLATAITGLQTFSAAVSTAATALVNSGGTPVGAAAYGTALLAASGALTATLTTLATGLASASYSSSTLEVD